MARRQRRASAAEDRVQTPVEKAVTSEALDDGGKAPPAKLGGGMLDDAPRVTPPKIEVARSLIFKVEPDHPEDMEDTELVAVHNHLHDLMRRKAAAPDTVKATTKALVDFHARVVDELEVRKAGHPPPPDDGMDDASEDFEVHDTTKGRHTTWAMQVAKAAKPKGYLAETTVRSPIKFYGPYRQLAQAIASRLPEHSLYVEPFVGGGNVYFAKRPSEKEVISDKDPAPIRVFQFLKGMSDSDIKTLQGKDWKLSDAQFKRVVESDPKGDLEFFYRVAYLSAHAMNPVDVLRGKKVSPRFDGAGRVSDMPKRLEALRKRLENTTVLNADYKEVLSKYGSEKGAVWMLEPPYPATADDHFNVADVDYDAMAKAVHGLKGGWVMLFEASKEADRFNANGVTRAKVVRVKPRFKTGNVVHAYLISDIKGVAKAVQTTIAKSEVSEEEKVYELTAIESLAADAAMGADPISVGDVEKRREILCAGEVAELELQKILEPELIDDA